MAGRFGLWYDARESGDSGKTREVFHEIEVGTKIGGNDEGDFSFLDWERYDRFLNIGGRVFFVHAARPARRLAGGEPGEYLACEEFHPPGYTARYMFALPPGRRLGHSSAWECRAEAGRLLIRTAAYETP